MQMTGTVIDGRRRRERLAVARIRFARTRGSRWGNGTGGSSDEWSVMPEGGALRAPGYSGPAQTPRVDTFTLYVALRADRPLDDDALTELTGRLRPDDGLSVWTDEQDPALFRVSRDSAAGDLAAALQAGHVLAAEARGLAPFPARVVEVSAMTDEDVMVWRAEV
jgi:hypothetical protein